MNLIEPLVRLRGGEAIQAGAMPPPLSYALEIGHLAAFPLLNPNPVLELSAMGEIRFFNQAAGGLARELGLENPAQMLPPDIAAITRQCLADGTPKLRVKIQAGQRVISWSFFPVQLTNTVHGYGSDITEENRLHRDLIESSRMAGMAEVATSVLHNVGNVLNSVNVSSSLVSDKVRQSKIANLGKAVALLLEHEQDLAAFLTHDAKGKQLPRYLHNLADHLAAEQVEIVKELALLTKNVDHIKEIVAMQQNYSRISGICEMVPPADLVEDAVRMNGASLDRHEIELVREYTQTPAILVEKHKVLQILVNLIRNAENACNESGRADKRLTLRVGLKGGNRVGLSVIDNGIGISAENLPRVFNHGFTTRRYGHGFGLHSGALAARELGGALTLSSDGVGKGAQFTLELPLQPPQDAPTRPAAAAALVSIPSPRRNGNSHPVAAGQDPSSPHHGIAP